MQPRLALIVLPATLVACVPSPEWGGESSQTDLDLFEPEPPPPIEDVPDGVNELLTSEDVEALRAVGMQVYTGDTPPWIEGDYLLDTLTISYDDVSGAIGAPIIETYLGFHDQDNDDGTLDTSLHDAISDGTGLGGFVSGEGDCFTVWVRFDGHNFPDDCVYQMAQLFSGCVDDAGIEDLQFGYVLVDRSGPCQDTVPIDHRRVMDEVDGLAERLLES